VPIEWTTVIEGGIPILGGLYASALEYGAVSRSSAMLKLGSCWLVVAQVESNSIGQSVKSSSDYCRLCEAVTL
jgi:hypothetical protein